MFDVIRNGRIEQSFSLLEDAQNFVYKITLKEVYKLKPDLFPTCFSKYGTWIQILTRK